MEPKAASSSEALPLHARLARRIAAWRAAGASNEVIRWLTQGARCEWTAGPPPPFDHGVSLSRESDLTPQQSEFLEGEVSRCLGTGGWEHAPPSELTHISRVHLVPKKVEPGAPPKWRVVVDLRPTNAYCVQRGCKYETLKMLQRMARRGDWMISFDLADGYHHVPVAEDHRRYMTFALPPAPGSPAGTPPRYFRCAALPFGWTASPRIFTKVMRVMVRMLRAPMAPTVERMRLRTAAGRRFTLRVARRARGPHLRGMRVLSYVDDFLCLASSRREALRCRARVQHVLDFLGITRHPEKGVWEPTQRLEHLGLDIDTAEGLFRVPPKKITGLAAQARAICGTASRERRLIEVRHLASFTGYAQSVYLACPPARFYLRSIHDVMATRTSWDCRVRLTRQALRDLRWWQQLATADVSRAIWRSPIEATLHCDASRLGWGGVLNGTVPASGMWTGRERGRHINYHELRAVELSLAAFRERLRGRSVLLWEDNMTVLHVLTNRTTRSPELMHLLRRLWRIIDEAGITLTVRYIASEENSLADALSRGSPFDELTLRRPAFARLQRRWGPHTVDRYARAVNAQLPRFNTAFPAAASEGAPALAQRWLGENNYVFPPVVELPRVAQLLVEQPSVAATVVTPYWPAQAWFQLLTEIAVEIEVEALTAAATPPPWLHESARHGLIGAQLTFFRVEGHRAGTTRGALPPPSVRRR